MSNNPGFATTPRSSSVIVPATLDASLTAPTNVATVFTPGASGSKVEEIDIVGLGTTVAGRCNLFVFDGSTYHLVDQYIITAVTPSATVQVFRMAVSYPNLFVPSGYSLRATVMEAGNQSLLKLTGLGGDF